MPRSNHQSPHKQFNSHSTFIHFSFLLVVRAGFEPARTYKFQSICWPHVSLITVLGTKHCIYQFRHLTLKSNSMLPFWRLYELVTVEPSNQTLTRVRGLYTAFSVLRGTIIWFVFWSGQDLIPVRGAFPLDPRFQLPSGELPPVVSSASQHFRHLIFCTRNRT